VNQHGCPLRSCHLNQFFIYFCCIKQLQNNHTNVQSLQTETENHILGIFFSQFASLLGVLLTLLLPMFLSSWCSSFQKESHGKAKPTRNIYFLELGFSWACMTSWNSSRSSYVFSPMDIRRCHKGKEKVNTLMRLRIYFDCSVKSTRWNICFYWSILVIRLTSNN